MRPPFIPAYIQRFWNLDRNLPGIFEETSNAYARLNKGREPEVSVVIPAYNEEENIVQTLASICNNQTSRAVEVIVVNNNSKDRTEELVKKCGVNCVFQPIQGITAARNMGLSVAKGRYILNADADTIYPEGWIEEMIKPLDDESVAAVYGRFSFISIAGTPRIIYFFYEHFADLARKLNAYLKDEAVNFYGCSSGFRKIQALEVDGYNHPPGATEDGWLGLKLRNKGFGRLHCVKSIKTLVWTNDRRIHIDGGMFKGTLKRMKRILLRR